MPERPLKIDISPPQKNKTDFVGTLIEFKSNGHCAIGVVEKILRYGFEVDVLASDFELDVGECPRIVPFRSPYKSIKREDLPVYISLKYSSKRFEKILKGDE